jgi:hypothetical protein
MYKYTVSFDEPNGGGWSVQADSLAELHVNIDEADKAHRGVSNSRHVKNPLAPDKNIRRVFLRDEDVSNFLFSLATLPGITLRSIKIDPDGLTEVTRDEEQRGYWIGSRVTK